MQYRSPRPSGEVSDWGQMGQLGLEGAPSHHLDPNSSAAAKLSPRCSLNLWAVGFAHISPANVSSLPTQLSESSPPPPPVTLFRP